EWPCRRTRLRGDRAVTCPAVSIILPVYNERESLPVLWVEMERVLPQIPGDVEVVIVDDGSSDGSAEIARDLAAADPRVRLVRLGANAGLTAALLAGFAAARGDNVVTMDSDLQYDPADIPPLLAHLDRYD